MTSSIDERKVRKFDWEVCKNDEPQDAVLPRHRLLESGQSEPDRVRKRGSQVLALWMMVVLFVFLWLSIHPLLQDGYISRDPAWTVAAP